jgi:hypothetical protein
MLEEYKVLRAEILDRTKAQQTMVQIHITALAALLSLALTEAVGPWVVLVIPIEASVLGYWYWDQAWAIIDIASHIRVRIEGPVNSLMGGTALSWETGNQDFQRNAPERRQQFKTFSSLLTLTFQWPTVFALALSAVVMIANLLELLPKIAFFEDTFHTPPPFSWPQLIGAAMIWGFGLWLYLRYRAVAKLPDPAASPPPRPAAGSAEAV